MNCSEIQELLSAYYDRELADDQRSRLSNHLHECSDCARELAGFEQLSEMAGALSTPAPPEQIWNQLEQQFSRQSRDGRPGDARSTDGQTAAKPVVRIRRWSLPTPRRLALAATVLVAVGIGWLGYRSWFAHGVHAQFAAEFGHYLEEFRRDPDAAQGILLAKYDNQLVGPEQAMEQVGYRPAVAKGLPAEYTLKSTHVMKMPCCTCVQSVCKRRDGSTMAIFEHDGASCHDKHCCFMGLDHQIAASWKRGARHITLIGVRSEAEVSQMVAWLDEKERPVSN